MIDENNNYRTFEYARDFQDFENSLKTEAKSTYFELLSQTEKGEIDYLSKNFAVIMEKSLNLIPSHTLNKMNYLQKMKKQFLNSLR